MLLPNLDDRSFDDLVAEAVSMIHGLCPEWTDHNPSDPGIVLIELLAWLTEILIYRANEIPEANYRAFIRLLNGPREEVIDGQVVRQDFYAADDLETAIRHTVRALRQRFRAVTPEDFEYLLLHQWPVVAEAVKNNGVDETGRLTAVLQADPQLIQDVKNIVEDKTFVLDFPPRRVCCLPRLNASVYPPKVDDGHLSVFVVTQPKSSEDRTPVMSGRLQRSLARFLDTRRLLTTRLHVARPSYVPIRVKADLTPLRGFRPETVESNARQAILDFYHPTTGGPDGRGYPFGRTVYGSEISALLDDAEGVDYVAKDIQLTRNGAPATFVPLEPYQLVDVDDGSVDLTVKNIYEENPDA